MNRLNIIELLLSKEYNYNLKEYNTIITDIIKEAIESKEENDLERCYLRLLELSKEGNV